MELLEENTILVNEGVISQIMINRPDALNTVSLDIFQGLILAFERILKFPELKAVTIWGAGEQAFATGAEVNGYMDLGRRALADYVELGNRALRVVERCPVPVISAVNGYCFGAGLELALASDIIIATSNAQFAFPEVSLGSIPVFGGIARLMQRVGSGVAKKMVFSSEVLTANEALQCGLIDEIAPEGKLTNRVDKLAENIAAQAPLAVKSAKKLFQATLEAKNWQCQRENIELYLELARSADWEEGADAFMQKRPPRFTGR